jgi:CRP-like cAMP-binding protein
MPAIIRRARRADRSSRGLCEPSRTGFQAGGRLALAAREAVSRQDLFFALVDAGKTKQEAAEALGISIRSVFRILRTRKGAEKAVTWTRTRPQVSA